MSDWFKYHRSSGDHHLRSKPLVWIYWLHCLESAAWKEHEVVWGGNEFTLEKGSFITTLERDSVKNGLSVSQIRTARKQLQICSMIYIKATNQGTLIHVCKWKEFQARQNGAIADEPQPDDTPIADTSQTLDKQVATTEEGKEGLRKKRRKRITTAAPEYSPEFEKFWTIYPKAEDKKEAWELYLTLFHQDAEKEKELLNFAFRYAADFSGNRKRYARKAKYMLRDSEWQSWEPTTPKDPEPKTKEEPKPPSTGIATREAYHLLARNKCPHLQSEEIYRAYGQGIHIKTLIETNAP